MESGKLKATDRYDVVVIGAGLAGLCLCRQLLMNTDKTILLLDKRSQIPPKKQKVGESLVQVGGYYFSRVLDLEEYLLRNHYMKYNLRFYWKSAERDNSGFEDYSQVFIRNFSNIGCYQLDRNALEAELLRLNRRRSAFEFRAPVRIKDIELSKDQGPHKILLKSGGRETLAEADWLVDTSGRAKLLSRKMNLGKRSQIRHGSSFLWVEGLVNIDKLSGLSWKEIRLEKYRRSTGHLPIWLATNHFMGEGFWFWVIPLQGLTSLGLVYDKTIFPAERVSTPKKLMEWVCEEFPLFARDLPHRKILDYGWLKDYAYDCQRTIHSARWALAGEAGRFLDPLYSPGSDFIAVHNTLIMDAILTPDPSRLAVKCHLHEMILRALYQSMIPTFSVSYDVLGDPETFALKYTWELSVYFAFLVFPFINDLFPDSRFALPFLSKFARLGVVNSNLQAFLSAFYQWKKAEKERAPGPIFHELTEISALRRAQSAFYNVGVSADEAGEILEEQLSSLEELARFIVAHATSVVLSDPRIVESRQFVESIDLEKVRFDPQEMRDRQAKCGDQPGSHRWSWDPRVLDRFRSTPRLSLTEA